MSFINKLVALEDCMIGILRNFSLCPATILRVNWLNEKEGTEKDGAADNILRDGGSPESGHSVGCAHKTSDFYRFALIPRL